MEEIINIWNMRWDWSQKLIHDVVNILHPLWRSEEKRLDEELCQGWATYTERVFTFEEVDILENQLLTFCGPWKSFARPNVLNRNNHLQPISWWEKFGFSTPLLTSLACRVLSQVNTECLIISIAFYI